MYGVNGLNFGYVEIRLNELRGQASDYRLLAWQQGMHAYQVACSRAKRLRFWRGLTRRAGGLFDLNRLGRVARNQHYQGIRTVPLAQIRGTEGRSRDFDGDFNPARTHSRNRWLSVYCAMFQGMTLPPVELIEVRGVYFVRDGHHRVSVARAMGRIDIEAEVTVWEVEGRLPWDRPAPVAVIGSPVAA